MNILNLPTDLIWLIARRIDPNSVLSFALAHSRFYDVVDKSAKRYTVATIATLTRDSRSERFIKKQQDVVKNRAAYYAAKLGDLSACRTLARYGANDYDHILCFAAFNGHRDVCDFARLKASAKAIEMMLVYATNGDQESMCYLAKKWGARNFENMLKVAASNGNLHLCHVAIDFGAVDVDKMLQLAAEHGHESLCKHVIELYGDLIDMNHMLVGAAKGGHSSLCTLAIDNGADDVNSMLAWGARSKQPKICAMAIRLGARDFDTFLEWAKLGGDKKIVDYATELVMFEASRT